MNERYKIGVEVITRYLEAESIPDKQRFVFSYTITIHNEGSVPAMLMSRHWIIRDGNGRVQEVRGEGVVGATPHLQPGERFQYTSGAMLETDVGIMEGNYRMRADDGNEFDAKIPAFTLAVPRVLH